MNLFKKPKEEPKEKPSHSVQRDMDDVLLRIWKLENPPVINVGDIIKVESLGVFICFDIQLHKKYLSYSHYSYSDKAFWEYGLINEVGGFFLCQKHDIMGFAKVDKMLIQKTKQ